MKNSRLQQLSNSTILKKIALSSMVIFATLTASLPSQALKFPQTGDRGAPARTSGGGTRGDRCAADIDNPIKALVPKNNVSTFAEPQARLWLHIPAELSTQTAEFFVKHPDTHEVIYEQQTALSKLDKDGLIEIKLPAAKADGSPLLVDNQNYFWEFAIICDTADRSRDRFTQGFLHKVTNDDTLQARLEASARELNPKPSDPNELIAEMYAKSELWQETLSYAIELNRARPGYWNELLTSVDLEELADPYYAHSALKSIQQLSLPQLPTAEQ